MGTLADMNTPGQRGSVKCLDFPSKDATEKAILSMNHYEADREYFLKKYEEYRHKVGDWINRIWKVTPDDDYEQSEDYKSALNFYRDFEQKDGVDYSGIVDYARELYDRYDKTDKILDDKADSIIKYLGGGSALITFGALMSIKSENYWSSVFAIVALVSLLPSLVCALLAVRKAIHVRRPRSSASLPDVHFALEMAEYHKTKEKLNVNLWLIFYPICEAAYYRNLQKARLVESAHCLYLWAMGLLIVPVVSIAICLTAAAGKADKSGHADNQPQLKAVQKP